MKLLKGLVVGNKDLTRSGIFQVALVNYPDVQVDVTYTSPFYSIHQGGFFAIPPIDSEVIIIQDDELNEYFYLSTIVSEPKLTGVENKVKDPLINTRKIYTPNGSPKAITITNAKGAGLKISNYFSDSTEPIHNKVVLETPQGSKLSLEDNPNRKEILLRNESGDGITITSTPNSVHSAGSMEIKTRGSQRFYAGTGELRMTLTDGRDIYLENKSTGTNAQEKSQAGNVNITSVHRDINITCDASQNNSLYSGKIFIHTSEGVVQISSGGGITIYAKGDLNLKSLGDINMQAGGSIRLKAAESIEIRSDQGDSALTSSSGRVIVGGGNGLNAGLTGTPLNLNSAIDIGPGTLDIDDPIKNAYGK